MMDILNEQMHKRARVSSETGTGARRKLSIINCQRNYRRLWIRPSKEVHPLRLPFCRYLSMDSHCTRLPSTMLLPSDMAGYQTTCLPPVTVANNSAWNMHSHVPKAAFLSSDTTK